MVPKAEKGLPALAKVPGRLTGEDYGCWSTVGQGGGDLKPRDSLGYL